jgi:hypothetical protein
LTFPFSSPLGENEYFEVDAANDNGSDTFEEGEWGIDYGVSRDGFCAHFASSTADASTIMDSYKIPPKFDLTPRRHHGYAFLLFIVGTLFPPLGTLPSGLIKALMPLNE